MLECGRRLQDESLRERARRMLDWLVSIQHDGGSFQGGRVGTEPDVPVTFNTGQILTGLAAGSRELGTMYTEPMRRAAEWLVATQDCAGVESHMETRGHNPRMDSTSQLVLRTMSRGSSRRWLLPLRRAVLGGPVMDRRRVGPLVVARYSVRSFVRVYKFLYHLGVFRHAPR